MRAAGLVSTVEQIPGVNVVHVIVPDGIDDPARASGGNLYDRRICSGLEQAGWRVEEHAAAGSWPWPTPEDLHSLARLLTRLPSGGLVLVDGLIASTVPTLLVPAAGRLRLVVLVHLPLGDGPPGHEVRNASVQEAAVLSAAAAVLATSSWTRQRLLDLYSLPPRRVHVAEPGVDPASVAPGSDTGSQLLCVASVTSHKGHDLLVSALARIRDLPWRCTCIGSLDREPDFVRQLRDQVERTQLGERILFRGPLAGRDLDEAYAAADTLVLASHAETYGMVVTEALARGLPVIATAVGGLPVALGATTDGRRPGLLLPPDDVPALATALRRWLTEPRLREQLRQAARDRRTHLSDWSTTSSQIARVLTMVAA